MRPTYLAMLMCLPVFGAADPVYEAQFIFAPQELHAHSSSLVQLPNGDLFAVWYIGSGERTADDVRIEAARLPKGARRWSPRYTIADTPGLPDCNPIVFVDRKKQLTLAWPVILDNHWESALLKYRVSAGGWKSDPVQWSLADNIILLPRGLDQKLRKFAEPLMRDLSSGRDRKEVEAALGRASDKLYNRLGWMPRVHPLQLPSGRILLPLYTDTYSIGIIAISDDDGRTWTASEPLVSLGGVQPSLVRKRDGTIVAYMRDNGPPPKRVITAESKDDGMNWSDVRDTEIPNPGSSVEAIALRDGSWLMVLNDTEQGRRRLSVWMSEDEGRTWPYRRALEDRTAGGYSYPSVIQDAEGFVEVTYSHSAVPEGGPKQLQTIKHVKFSPGWVKQPPARANREP